MSDKFFLKNTKIVSTFGPSITFDLNVNNPKGVDAELQKKVEGVISSVFAEGVNCVRYNFSHGSIDENETRYAMIHKVQKDFLSAQKGPRRYLRAVTMMADTKGPEIRVFDMGAGVSYEKGQEIDIYCVNRQQGSEKGFSVVDATGTYDMSNDCKVGNYVLVEDGKMKLQILSVDKANSVVRVRVMNNSFLKTNKRINLPGADYSMDFLSQKDITDIKYAIDKGFEYVALSFVNKKENIAEVRALIDSYCKEKGIPNLIKVYSKIETLQSCNNIDEIIENSDGIMIARGDLGLEIPYYEVPFWTKQIIKKCWQKAKPVITATQMLDSLERNVVATRAEVSDVYRAAELGSDCTMLSGETAQGQFPVLAVETMTNIVFESEKHFNHEKFVQRYDEELLCYVPEEYRGHAKAMREAPVIHKDARVMVMARKDFCVDTMKAFSTFRLRTPLFVFVHVDNIENYLGEPKWDSPEYLNMKRISETSLGRGLNVVFVDGKEESCPVTMFKECFETYTGSKVDFPVLFSTDWSVSWKISE